MDLALLAKRRAVQTHVLMLLGYERGISMCLAHLHIYLLKGICMKKTLLPVLAKTLLGLLVAVGVSSASAQAKKRGHLCAPGHAASTSRSDGR